MSLNNRWAVLGLLFLVRFCMGFQFQAVAAVSPYLIEQLSFSYAQVGTLMGVFMLPGMVFALLGGMLGVRIGDKKVVLLGLLVMVAGALLFSVSSTFSMALAARLISGTGSAMVGVQTMKMVTDWFDEREVATALSILLSSFPLGIALTLISLGPIAEVAGWQTAVGLTAIILVAIMVVFLVFYRDFSDATTSDAHPAKFWEISRRELGLIFGAGMIWTLMNTGYIVTMNFTPTLLVSRGETVAMAGFMTSLASLISIVTVPLGGFLADRTGRYNWFIVGGTLGSGICMALLSQTGPALLWLMLSGLLISGAPGSIMKISSEVLSPRSRSTGFGVFYTIFYVGTSIYPFFAGKMQDITGVAGTANLVGAIGMLSAIPALILFRLAQKRLMPPPPANPST